VLEAAFILLEFSSPSRRIFIGSHSLPPSLVRRIGPSPCTSRSSLYGYLRIYCCKRLLALALLSCKRPLGPGDFSVTTALAIQVYFFSNKV
jgi:hypothetical protein